MIVFDKIVIVSYNGEAFSMAKFLMFKSEASVRFSSFIWLTDVK